MESLHPIEHTIYDFLRAGKMDELTLRLREWRYTEQQVNLILAQAPTARACGFPAFEQRLLHLAATDPLYPLYTPTTDDTRGQQAVTEQYRALLRRKRVALVGPSRSIAGSAQGKHIESYDLVVRMNFQWPIPEHLHTDAGTRMDILYHCCNGDAPVRTLLNELFLSTQFACFERGGDCLALKTYCSQNEIPALNVTSVYEELHGQLDTFPNTGLVAIEHLLRSDLAELFIVGISFFQEPYYDGYDSDGSRDICWEESSAPKRIWCHEFEPQIAYFKQRCTEDPRLVVHEPIKERLGL
jgi:hypothetical protein